MADRYLYQDDESFHPGEVVVNLQFTATTAGAVPATTAAGWRRAGIKSVAKSGTSDYTVTFDDSYFSCLSYKVDVEQASFDKTHAGCATVVPTDVSVTTSPATFKFTTRSTDGNMTAVAITSGDVLRARFVLTTKQGNG